MVEYEGEYFIKVTFATNEMSKENMNLKTIKVLLKCQNNQFDVVDMWYKSVKNKQKNRAYH